MSAEGISVWRNIAIVVFIVAGLWSLAVVLCREWVKNDLRERMLDPISVRWRPFMWRTNWLTCAFKVLYSDFDGRTHRGTCWTYWFRKRVTWETDEMIEREPDKA